MSLSNDFSIASHWTRDFDEQALQEWAEDLRTRLRSPEASLGLVFMTPRFFPHAKQVLEILRVHAGLPLLAGCSSQGLIFDAEEIEQQAGLTLGLYSLPGSKLKAFHFTQEQVEEANGPGYWPLESEIEPDQTNGWLTFIDPFHLDSESFSDRCHSLPDTGWHFE